MWRREGSGEKASRRGGDGAGGGFVPGWGRFGVGVVYVYAIKKSAG
jgi:hypothetical protein